MGEHDERLVLQVPQIDDRKLRTTEGVAVAERVLSRHQDAHLFGADRQIVVARPLILPQGDEAEVDVPGLQLLLQIRHTHFLRTDAQLIVFIVELRIDLCEHADAAVGRQADLQLRFSRVRDIVDLLIGVLLDQEGLTGTLQIGFPGFGRVPVGTGAHEELCAQLLFQLEQLLVQRRLGDKEILCGFRDVILFRDFNHIFTFPEIHASLLR